MTKFTREFIRAIPKTDLHVHLDGSLRLATLIELAKEQKVELPSYTEEGLSKLVFKKVYADLDEYLLGFLYTAAVMVTPEALERIAYELALDNFEEGVRYVEPRFAPQRHAHKSFSLDETIISVDLGLSRAKKEINARPEIRDGSEPPFDYGIIGCAIRMFTPEYSGYYRQLMGIHPHMPKEDLYGLAALDLVRTMIDVRNDKGLPVTGFDIAGAERGYPAEDYKRAFDLAVKHFFKKTVHAGEAYGPVSIFQAITDCHADRIGHGTNLFDEDMVELPTAIERSRYVRELWQYIADRRTCIEVCLTSNMQTVPGLKEISKHPFAHMFKNRLSLTLCTDNRLVSHTSVTDEIELAVRNFPIEPRKLKDIIIYGFKRSFYPGDYMAKRAYIRRAIDYYEKMEKKFGV
ncbi:MAG: adenosine deaminase family protein [Pseudomonadota bacterium]